MIETPTRPTHKIDRLIAQLDQNALHTQINAGDIRLRDYQLLVYYLCSEIIRSKQTEPVVGTASVGAGKTLMMGAIAKRANDRGLKTMILAHQLELVEQNSAKIWEMRCENAIYCAGAKLKKTNRPTIVGSVKSVKNGLHSDLKLYVPDILIIDECHMVDTADVMSDAPTTDYAIIIKEMQKRCLEVNNRPLRILGFTGSPFRGTQSIIGGFWKKQLVDISSEYLVERGFLVPTIFGMPEMHYDLDDFRPSGEDGAKDFTDAQMAQMQKEILKQSSKTKLIVEDILKHTQDRGGVLITCAGRQHCEQVAQYLPENSWRIIDAKTKEKDRKEWLELARNEGVKFILQIGALTTGVDVPYWDTSVLLRKIGSLTLLIQLLGRGMRLYGDKKLNHLVLDYSDTMSEMFDLYSNPMLDEYEQQRAKREQIADLVCPECGELNSQRARRCAGKTLDKETRKEFTGKSGNRVIQYKYTYSRCEHFFKFNLCACGCKNDVASRYCRECDNQLIDPNANLSTKHYTDDDFIECTGFDIKKSSDGKKILFMYQIDQKWISEILDPSWSFFGGKFRSLVKEHIEDKAHHGIASVRNIDMILSKKHLFRKPKRITHRVNDKGFNLIHRKEF